MVPSRGTGGYVEAFYEQDSQPPESAVSCRSRSGYTSTDDDDVIFVHSIPVYFLIFSLKLADRLTGV